MLSVQAAEATIFSLVQPLEADRDREWVSLTNAYGRILAAAVRSDLDFPYWDNSAMDGYAVQASDLRGCSAENPVALEVVMDIPAGTYPPQPLLPGQAARILTGAMLPPGADAIVIQEQTRRDGDRVWIQQQPEPGAWVRSQGAYYRAGAPLLEPGTYLQAPELAILATVQCTSIPVYRRPIVSLLSTGDELIAPHQVLQRGQIVDSNQPAIAALVTQTGAIAQCMDIFPDQKEILKTAIAQAIAQSDVVISTGGVSVGDYDYIEELLVALGGTLQIQSVAIKPGKPLTVATFPNPNPQNLRPILYFGLPGNPVSAPVSFWRFVQPALRKLAGALPPWTTPVVRAITQQALKADGRRETYLWGHLGIRADGLYEFNLAGGSHSSGNLINLAGTNGLAVLTVDRPHVAPGDWVLVMQICHGSL